MVYKPTFTYLRGPILWRKLEDFRFFQRHIGPLFLSFSFQKKVTGCDQAFSIFHRFAMMSRNGDFAFPRLQCFRIFKLRRQGTHWYFQGSKNRHVISNRFHTYGTPKSTILSLKSRFWDQKNSTLRQKPHFFVPQRPLAFGFRPAASCAQE